MPADQVLAVTEREGAHSYDAPGAEYTHRVPQGGDKRRGKK